MILWSKFELVFQSNFALFEFSVITIHIELLMHCDYKCSDRNAKRAKLTLI